jgi:hypothetical protein
MTRPSLSRFAAGAALTGLVALAASPAVALPHPFAFSSTSSSVPGPGAAPNTQAGTNNQAKSLAFIQQAGTAAINTRLASLNKVVADLGKVPQGCDVSALISTAQSDITQLTALEGHLQADTTVQEAKTDAQQIFMGFRVYALVVPVDEMVVAACRITDVANKVNALVQKLQGVKDQSIAALVADMGTQAQGAVTAVNGVAADLEKLTPDSWNNDPKELLGYRQDMRTAREDLEKARQDGHKILVILHHDFNVGGNGGPAGPNAGPNASSGTSSTTSSTSATTSSTVAG